MNVDKGTAEFHILRAQKHLSVADEWSHQNGIAERFTKLALADMKMARLLMKMESQNA